MANNTKRKRSVDENHSGDMESNPKKKAKTRPFKPKQMPDGRSLLLELPPEIRTLVYEFVNDDSSLYATVHRGVITDNDPLLRVSKLTRKEYEGLLYTKANVDATVKNFDFSHLVRLLNRLEENEFHTLTKDSVRVQREFTLTISLTDEFPANPEKLHSWLHRFNDETKRGCQVDFQYEVEMRFPCALGRCTHALCARDALHKLRVLNKKMNEWIRNLPNGRLRYELVKIRNALEGRFYPEL